MLTVVGKTLTSLVSARSGTYRWSPVGAPTNFSVALSRRGVPVSRLARLSDDRFGHSLRAYLTTRGVDDDYWS